MLNRCRMAWSGDRLVPLRLRLNFETDKKCKEIYTKISRLDLDGQVCTGFASYPTPSFEKAPTPTSRGAITIRSVASVTGAKFVSAP